MNIGELNDGIKQVGKTSIDIKGYYDNHDKLVEGLNNVPVAELDKCLDYYASRSGVIVDLRKEIIETLKKGKITVDTLSELLNKHRKGKENQFKSYKNWFSIFYPPITFYGHNSIREFLKAFIEKLISDLKLSEKVKSTLIDFQGARQQGADRLWLAIYNKDQKSQSQGLQFFMEFFNGTIKYGVYRHSNQSYIKQPVNCSYEEFDYNKLLGYFTPETATIENDTPKKRDYKKQFITWLNTKYGVKSGTTNSYLKSIDILSQILNRDLFKTRDARFFKNLYQDLKNEQKKENGKYYHKDAPSYGTNGFYSASIKSYIEFLNTLDEIKQPQENMNFSLNTILYGPPGTGKTYNTVFKAAQIISPNTYITDYDEALKIFNNNLGGRIEFITFHQSYSYEDFIQGLRPDVETKGQLSFDKKDGIFTRIATEALFEYYKKAKRLKAENKERAEKKDENEVYLDFIEHLKNIESKDFKSATGSLISLTSFTKNDNVEFKHANSSRTYLVSGNRLLKLFEIFPDIKQIKNVHTDIRDAIGGCNATVYWVALKEFISFYNKYEKSSDEEKEEVFEEVSYESKKKLLATFDLNLLREVSTEDVPNYVIIIDEINRANISRVFGELITLIESDKRSHGKIPLSCTLPSGEQFVVPSNLYLVGTMNTADKSIALLDIALRRRFEFVPMYPNYNLDYEAKEVLQSINEKIIELKGYDFQIGHAYFMTEDFNLVDCINNKVIPLLLEYFLNDENEVKNILTHAGLEIQDNGWPLQINGN